MRMYDVITKKKRGEALSEDEIREFVRDYTEGNIPDYQASALLMAICFNGMNADETYALTDAIAKSGDTVDLSEFGALSADKHSTGGVGDKTTLIVAPIAAALGCKVAKMSGRGLGHTGGTIDKLESIPGYTVSLSPERFLGQVRDIGIAVIGQSGNLAPADKKLYALRDVTATVDSIPLITSSVMGKKLAAGAKTIVLDVKYGSGAFIKSPEDAKILAENMVRIGNMCERRTAALITNMDSPLGLYVGNTLEIKEAIDTLLGRGPADLTEICIALSSTMASLSLGITIEEARRRAEDALASGKAFNKFKEWIAAQGGDLRYIEDPTLFPKAKFEAAVIAPKDGFITRINAESVGIAAMKLGAGRKTKEDVIDYSAGIKLAAKIGDKVLAGDTIAILYTNNEASIDEAKSIVAASVDISKEKPKNEKLIYGMIS